MRKEIQLILIGALTLQSCAPFAAKAQSPETDTPTPNILYDPTLTPSPEPSITPTKEPSNYDYMFAVKPTLTPLSTLEVLTDPVADTCVLPYKGAILTGGLQFLSTIKNNGTPVTEQDGTIHRHLGLDFAGGYEGEDVVNMCDGMVVYSGAVEKGWGYNLGNIVVMKYTYFEGEKEKNVYMRYAHMENITDLPPGTVVAKGQKIGEMGHSGGWGPEHTHLHIDLWKEEAWNRIIVERSDGNLKKEVGYYAQAETWSDNTMHMNLLDPRKWLSERLK